MARHAWSLAAALSFALLAGACADKQDDATLTQDTALSRDLALANRDTGAQPQLRDVPAEAPAAAPAPAPARTPSAPAARPAPRPAPRAATPAPTPSKTPSGNTVRETPRGSEGTVGTIAAGTTLSLTSNDRVCTNTHKPGDRFTATVTEAVQGSGGAVIPAGSKVVLQVSSVARSENANDRIEMGLAPQTISVEGKQYPIDAKIVDVQVEQVRASTKGDDAKKVIGGAVAGAILGQILGKDTKSTVIGAATGAAAGTAVAMGTANYDGCIPNGGRISIRLNTPTSVQAD